MHGCLLMLSRGGKLLHAASAWWDYSAAADRARQDQFLSRMRRMDYLSDDSCNASMLVESDESGLLRSVMSCGQHVIRSILPPDGGMIYNLGPQLFLRKINTLSPGSDGS